MLTKSWKSAAIMAALVLVTALPLYLLAQHQVSPGILDVLNNPDLFSTTEIVIGAVILLLILIIGIGLGAYLIYPLDESHFGLGGALRWLLVGLLLGLSVHGLTLLNAHLRSAWSDMPALLIFALSAIRLLLIVAALGLAHWLVFRLPSRLRKTDGG